MHSMRVCARLPDPDPSLPLPTPAAPHPTPAAPACTSSTAPATTRASGCASGSCQRWVLGAGGSLWWQPLVAASDGGVARAPQRRLAAVLHGGAACWSARPCLPPGRAELCAAPRSHAPPPPPVPRSLPRPRRRRCRRWRLPAWRRCRTACGWSWRRSRRAAAWGTCRRWRSRSGCAGARLGGVVAARQHLAARRAGRAWPAGAPPARRASPASTCLLLLASPPPMACRAPRHTAGPARRLPGGAGQGGGRPGCRGQGGRGPAVSYGGRGAFLWLGLQVCGWRAPGWGGQRGRRPAARQTRLVARGWL